VSHDAPQASLAAGDREQVLADTFVMLADTLVEDYDVVDLMDRLVAACLDLLGVAAAGLLLDDQRGHLVVVASSTEEARLLEVFQLQNNEGPCLECVRGGVAISSADLTTERARWPGFVTAALAAGFQSVAALPMRLRAQTIGALNLFDRHLGPLADRDQHLAQALADAATIGILQQRSARYGHVISEQLQHALISRVVVEQAKGVLAERRGISVVQALGLLRRHAREHKLKLTDVAAGVVHGGEL
jgi:ANTAR domain-containing protein/GAF domain-containing protein